MNLIVGNWRGELNELERARLSSWGQANQKGQMLMKLLDAYEEAYLKLAAILEVPAQFTITDSTGLVSAMSSREPTVVGSPLGAAAGRPLGPKKRRNMPKKQRVGVKVKG